MNEQIKELAVQAGLDAKEIRADESLTLYSFEDFDLERFAELVRQDERDNLYAKEMEQPTLNQSGTIAITVNKGLEADIDLLWGVNSADIEALEDAKATFEILKNKAPLKYQSMIYQSLSLIYTALGMSHSDAFQRIIDKARGQK